MLSTGNLEQYLFTIAFPIAKHTILVYKRADHILSLYEDTEFAFATPFFTWSCLKVGWRVCNKTELCRSSPALRSPAHPDRSCGRSAAVEIPVAAPAWCPPGSASAGFRWEDALRLQAGALQAACSPQDTFGEFLLWCIWNGVQTLEMDQCGQLIRAAQAPCSQSFVTMTIVTKALLLVVFPLLVRTEHK